MQSGDMPKPALILSLDIGTTNIRARVYNQNLDYICDASHTMNVSKPSANQLFDAVVSVMKEALQNGHLQAKEISSLAISVQRNSFLLWSKSTGQVFTPINTWNDVSSSEHTDGLNNSILLWLIHAGARCLHSVTGNERMNTIAILDFKTIYASSRLHDVLYGDTKLLQEARNGDLAFGCLDTWLVWKLTRGEVLQAEVGCASTTALYDPFRKCWSGFIQWLLGIPKQILPPVAFSSGHIGEVHESILGTPIPIHCVVGDQNAATFGSFCFSPGNVKLTLGTGAFVNLHCGFEEPISSIRGFSPIVGWEVSAARRDSTSVNYLAEAYHPDLGTVIDWLKDMEYFRDYADLQTQLESMHGEFEYSDVIFLPFFHGLQAPFSMPSACAAFMGLHRTTTRREMLHAAMQSLAFIVKMLITPLVSGTAERHSPNTLGRYRGFQLGQDTVDPSMTVIQVNGNASRSDWLMQEISDALQISLRRATRSEVTCLGAAMLAGLGAGLWSNEEEARSFAKNGKDDITNNNVLPSQELFIPNPARAEVLNRRYELWSAAVSRTFHWPAHKL